MAKRAIQINVTAPSNTGKTALLDYLVNYYSSVRGLKVARVKYPCYRPQDLGAVDFEDTGKRIDEYIRNGNPENLSIREFQILCAENRIFFDQQIRKWLATMDVILSEDGKYTSFIWGPLMDNKIKLKEFEKLNKGLIEPDIRFTLNGPRLGGVEPNHKFEQSNLWESCRLQHLKLARDLNWIIIDYKKVEGEEKIKAETARVGNKIIEESEYLLIKAKL